MASKRAAVQVPAKEPAAKHGRKRAATQAEDFASKEVMDFLKEHGVSKASYEPVMEIINHPLSGLPQDVHNLLLAIVPYAIAVPADQRHESQQGSVLMVDEVAGTVRAGLQQAVDEETGKVAELKAAQVEFDGSTQHAKVAGDEAHCAMEREERNVAQAASVLVQAREALQKAGTEQTKLNVELSEVRTFLAELDDVLSGSFTRLKDGDFEDGEMEGLAQTVMTACTRSSLEESLVTALPISLKKRERGAFDISVMSQAEQAIQSKIAALGMKVEAVASSVEAHAAVSRDAQAVFDEAVAQQALAADKLCSAQSVSSEAAMAAEAARVAAAEFGSKLAPALELQGAKQSELDNFLSYNVSLFEMLRDATSKKEVEVSPMDTATDVAKDVVEDVSSVLPASLAGA